MNRLESKQLQQQLAQGNTATEKVSVYYEWASRYYDQDRHSDAIPLYEAALKLEITPHGKAYFLAQIGICHYFLKNDRQAGACLTRAKRYFRPGSEDFSEEMAGLTHYYLGALYQFQGKLKQALREQLAALPYVDSLHKENRWLLYAAISRTYEQLGSNAEAIQYEQQALSVLSDDDPNLTYLYESIADNHLELGQFDEALKAYHKLLSLDPNFERKEEIYTKIGHCYQHLMNYRSALDTYQRILELRELTNRRKSMARLHGEIATCHFYTGDFNAALNSAREGLKLRPTQPAEKAWLTALAAISLCELGFEEKAIVEGEKALAISNQFPGLDQLLFRMALASHKLGDVPRFRKFRRSCLKSFPDHAWHKTLGKLA